ncbi:MAG: GAF domain-containing protein [Phycisphaerales bacterium]|nr:GAF domain-containing protein [Phycisphaerales bacterium]
MKLCDEHLLAGARGIASQFVSRHDRMSALVDLIWETFSNDGLSWVGFYLDSGTVCQDERLILGPHRDKPACSPIGMHGACGGCLTSKRPVVVADVRDLGGSYIACDPMDRSELVIACLDRSGAGWGVLDLDSHQIGYFTAQSAADLTTVVNAASISG